MEEQTLYEEIGITKAQIDDAFDEAAKLYKTLKTKAEFMHAIAGNEQPIIVKIYQGYVFGWLSKKDFNVNRSKGADILSILLKGL